MTSPSSPPVADHRLPGPGLLSVPRVLLDQLLHGERATDRLFDRYGDVFRARIPGVLPGISEVVFLRDPALVKPLFTSSADDVDSTAANRVLEGVYGPSSLFLIDGPQHRRLRRVLLRPLRSSALEEWTEVIDQTARDAVAAWPVDRPVRLHPLLLDASLDIILHVTLGLSGRQLAAWRGPMHDLLTMSVSEGYSVRYLLRRAGLLRAWRPFRRALRSCDRLVYEEIARRRSAPAPDEPRDLLDSLLHSEGEPLTDEELRDQLMTMLIAGHETSATLMAWAVERLVRHPDALAAATREARTGAGSAQIEAVLWETLRVRPPIAVVGRVTRRPVALGEHTLAADTLVVPHIRGIHEHPSLFDDPGSFRPERFLHDPPGHYTLVPFGGGQHRCLGDRLALHQSTVFLQRLLASRELGAVHGADETVTRKAVNNVPGDGTLVTLSTTA